ncbi:helix-hairpin-helix domain-containing protein [candidate division KSB1 bacterium]
MEKSEEKTLKEFRKIPGIGEKISVKIWNLGVHSMKELAESDPEELYLKMCTQLGTEVDRCVLYVFRCAVYFAANDLHDPELLKWWNWKNRILS